MSSSSQPARDHMPKDAQNLFRKSRLGLVKNRSINPYMLTSWKILPLIGQKHKQQPLPLSFVNVFRDEEFHYAYLHC